MKMLAINKSNNFSGKNWFNSLKDRLFNGNQGLLYFYDIVGDQAIQSSEFAGSQSVQVSKISGSMNATRCGDFDANFQLVKKFSQERLDGVAKAWRTKQLPPISLIQYGNQYFVQDGHHRVAIAVANNQSEIKANVTVVTVTENGNGKELAPAHI